MTNPTLDILHTRRSVVARNMTGPGPDRAMIEEIIRCGLRVPDHGKLGPWRVLILDDGARTWLGDVLADAFRRDNPDAGDEKIEAARGVLLRAPSVLCVISHVRSDKIPEWEQVLSAGAVCQNMLVAATSLGLACQWLTEWYAYEPAVWRALGLADNERIAGWIYLGSTDHPPSERQRPAYEDVVSDWRPPAPADSAAT